MTTLENRLREDLPALADALVDGYRIEATAETIDPAPVHDQVVELAVRPVSRRHRRRRWPTAAVAAAVVTATAGGVALRGGGDGSGVVTGTEGALISSDSAPDGAGTWVPIADAPIEPRPHAVTAWTGSEAVFWAGSSLDRGFAYTDGAAYDPVSDSWRNLVVPGWGHPGLTSAYFNGQLFVLAKGGGSTFDPAAGTWADLPQVEGMFLAATVATDQAIFGLGPAALNPQGQPDLAIARYEPETDSWIYGPVYERTSEQRAVVQGLAQLEGPVLWTGSEIVVWNGTAGGLAFDPASETWRPLPAPVPVTGSLLGSTAIMTDVGLVAVAEIDLGDHSQVFIATLTADGWLWHDTEIPITDLDTVTVASASDWIVAFSADRPPLTVHVPSGAWTRHDDSPLAGLESPNTVWTGESLVVWGGAASTADGRTDESGAYVAGAIWTPPPT